MLGKTDKNGMHRLPELLICDDDGQLRQSLNRRLSDRYRITPAKNAHEFREWIARRRFDVILLDLQLEKPREGLELLRELRLRDPDTAVLVLSGHDDHQTTREAWLAGANDTLSKAMPVGDIETALQRATETADLRHRRRVSMEVKKDKPAITLVGRSKATEKLRQLIEKYQRSDATILITGETGTGKEVVARQFASRHPEKPWVAIDASTFQQTIAESLLFGHEKGAFTGAETSKAGYFEEADGGILYFDEIANLPLAIQPKLLRVLQEREVMRLGSARTIAVDFRLICATNRSLNEAVKAGAFYPDLYQRIYVLPIELTPLRDRMEDLEPLVEHWTRERSGKPVSKEAMNTLGNYAWPGNVRELFAALEYASVFSEHEEIGVHDLPPRVQGEVSTSKSGSFYSRMEAYERKLLREALDAHGGKVSAVAASLQMDRSHLYTKLKQLGLKGT